WLTFSTRRPIRQPITPTETPARRLLLGPARARRSVWYYACNATDMQLNYTCNTSDAVTPLIGINTLLLASASTGTPDVITVGLTPSNDGYSHTGVGTGFVIASTNIGISASLTARARVPNTSLPLTTTVCQTDPNTGQCMSPPAPTVIATII